ncbi:MAG: O-antigen ligase family protein [Deltaproteobacteria bacterium]|nr:O-antigen ligase family protein [Deltaproteobacteria bacterium]
MFRAEIDSRAILPFLAVILVTLIGGMYLPQISIGVAFAVVGAIILALICFVSPALGLYILICAMLLGPQFGTGGLTGEGVRSRGLTLRLDDFLLLVIGFSWFLSTAVHKERGLFLKTPLNRYIAYYFIACLVSTLIGYMMGRVKGIAGIFFVLKYFEYYIVYFMAVNYLKEKKQMERLVFMMLIVCMVVCAIAIYQIPSGVRVSAPFEGKEGEPNTLGGYLLLMLSVVMGLLFNNYGTKKQKIFLGTLVFFILITLAATLSRSSWLALGPMLLALIWFSQRKAVVIIPLIFLVIISAFLLPTAVKERALYTFTQKAEEGQVKVGGVRIDTSTSARLNSWKNVLTRDFIQQPLIGYGVTGYSFIDAQYPRVLAETGILGMFFFIVLLVAIYRNAVQTWRRYADDPFFLGVSTGFLAGFFAMLTHAIGANTFIIVRIMEPFWFLTAIIIMIPQIAPSSQTEMTVSK